ncbi:uncharacterized protein EDB91DRAFT_1088017 [Suillus paluster]|uniref:uncharacterized protein n=1 Tax=Suillus paluster TaxID=48578 RepID=UPI001B85DA1A|nr:uncharacterized protein EDB91DRAFT_1088017 [Suillus paluster]KAG1722724.1 hypothetical protein EDB91DRAFT_1088017 [Suillus paluster]
MHLQPHNILQLQLPSGTRKFAFTSESNEPGPITVEMTIGHPPKRVPAPVDDSETEPESEPELEAATKVQPFSDASLPSNLTTPKALRYRRDKFRNHSVKILQLFIMRMGAMLVWTTPSPDLRRQGPCLYGGGQQQTPAPLSMRSGGHSCSPDDYQQQPYLDSRPENNYGRQISY